jgi:hypothetical protein
MLVMLFCDGYPSYRGDQRVYVTGVECANCFDIYLHKRIIWKLASYLTVQDALQMISRKVGLNRAGFAGGSNS